MDKELVILLYEDKIKKLLDKFLEPDFDIKADTYLNILLSHLSGKDDKDLGETLINLPVFTEWIYKCVTNWENGSCLPPANIVAFIFQIASLLSSNESRFITFNSHNVYTRLCNNVKTTDVSCSALVQLAHIKLLTSFLDHKTGTNWLLTSESWMDVLNFCLKGQTVYIAREGQNFIYQLLVASSRHNEVFCSTIVNKIMLSRKQFNHSNSTTVIEINECLQEQLLPSLKLVCYILEKYLQSDAFLKLEYNLPQIFVRKLAQDKNFWDSILCGSKNNEFVYELNKILLLNHFFTVAINCQTPFYDNQENVSFISYILGMFKQLIVKYDTINVLKLGCISQFYWKCISARTEKLLEKRDEIPMMFDKQVIIFQIFPILVISYKYCGFTMVSECDTFRDEFFTKVFSGWCQNTIRWTYNFRRRLEEDTKNIFDNAQKALMYVMKSRPYLGRESAILTFHFFVYILKDITRVMIETPETVDIFMKNHGYIITHLDAMVVFFKEFGFTWNECIETTCIMDIVLKLINVTSWPYRLVVQILKLLNLSVSRMTTPNLVLLIDRTSDSSIADLGLTLMGKLYDTNWEVRDSSLEVVHTICVMTRTTFPCFEKLVLEHDLPVLVVTMGLNDSESFVRASALKCLTEMVQVEAVWNLVLHQQQLPEKMMKLLYNETEAIVRCEAVSLLCAMKKCSLIESSLSDSINKVMLHTATSDLHWEVKLKTLQYWDEVIDNSLTLQGMIDGAFPTVTFSSEHKKIVQLTNEEIKNRLKKVLVQLSECGCLSVLMVALQDDCDIEVSKKALEVTKKLTSLLQKYDVGFVGVETTHQNVFTYKASLPLASSSFSMRNSDAVIDEIVNARDLQLLQHVYNGSTDTNIGLGLSYRENVTPQDFLTFIKSDFESSINERKLWLNNIDNLGSLLDDMLRNYDISDDTNAMDCY